MYNFFKNMTYIAKLNTIHKVAGKKKIKKKAMKNVCVEE